MSPEVPYQELRLDLRDADGVPAEVAATVDGHPILCVLDLRPREQGFILNDMQRVTSAYTKDNKPVEFVQGSEEPAAI